LQVRSPELLLFENPHPMIKWPLSSVPPQPNLRASMCLRFFNQVIAKLALKAGCGLLALHWIIVHFIERCISLHHEEPSNEHGGQRDETGRRIRRVRSRQFRCARRRRGRRRPDKRTAFKSGHCGAGPGRHRCARLCLVERGWAAAVRAAIGGDRAEKRAARSSAAGDRAATGRARRAEKRRQGAHGNAASGGAYHCGDEGGRGGLATPCSAPVLVLEPGDVGLGNRKATAIGRRRAAAPTPLTGNEQHHEQVTISQPSANRDPPRVTATSQPKFVRSGARRRTAFVVGFSIVTPAASFGRKRLSQPYRLFAGRLTANGSSLVRERDMKRARRVCRSGSSADSATKTPMRRIR